MWRVTIGFASVTWKGFDKVKKGAGLMVEELQLIEEALPPKNAATRRIQIRSMFASLEILLSDISAVLVKKIRPAGE